MTGPEGLTTPEDVARLFRRDGAYVFARWGRPVVPVVFGVDDATLAVIKGALELVVGLAGHRMAETDPELGANLMVFFCRDWAELPGVPNLDRLVPGLGDLVTRLEAERAGQYRLFRFDDQGAIRAAFVFLRVDAALGAVPADVLALDQAVRVICLWGDGALAGGVLEPGPEGMAALRPDLAAVIRAAYDPVLPVATRDPAHALRLFARAVR